MSVDAVTRARRALAGAIDEWADSPDDTRPTPNGDAGDWCLTADALRFLAILVPHLRPRAVLEFGSGASTCALGRAVAALDPPATVVALENDPRYAAQVRTRVEQERLGGTVAVVAAPVVVHRWHDRNVPVYLLDGTCAAAGAGASFDLVLVDGPPLPLGGREGSLYQALHGADPGRIVVLDDSRRASERELLLRMLHTFEGRIEAIDLLGFPKGLAAMLVTEPIPAGDLPAELTPAAGRRT